MRPHPTFGVFALGIATDLGKHDSDKLLIASTACDSRDYISIVIKGTVDLEGWTGDGDGSAYLDSLWVVGWIGACRGPDGKEHQAGPKYEFNMAFTVGDKLRGKYPTLDDSAIRNKVINDAGQELNSGIDFVIPVADLPARADSGND